MNEKNYFFSNFAKSLKKSELSKKIIKFANFTLKITKNRKFRNLPNFDLLEKMPNLAQNGTNRSIKRRQNVYKKCYYYIWRSIFNTKII